MIHLLERFRTAFSKDVNTLLLDELEALEEEVVQILETVENLTKQNEYLKDCLRLIAVAVEGAASTDRFEIAEYARRSAAGEKTSIFKGPWDD